MNDKNTNINEPRRRNTTKNILFQKVILTIYLILSISLIFVALSQRIKQNDKVSAKECLEVEKTSEETNYKVLKNKIKMAIDEIKKIQREQPYVPKRNLKSVIVEERKREIERQKALEKEQKKKEKQKKFEEDLYWLSHIIMAEVEGESYESKITCGFVVMNRVADEDYGNSIKDVIYQKTPTVQYECIRNNRINLEPNEDCIRAAKEILLGTTDIKVPSNVVYQAEFVQGSGVYKKIGNQYYCYK